MSGGRAAHEPRCRSQIVPTMEPAFPERIRVATAQINCTVGDIDGNVTRIVESAHQAAAFGAHIVVTPELSLCGYPPEDLLLRPTLYARTEKALAELCAQLAGLKGLYVVVGHPEMRGSHRYNAAS